MYKQQQKDCSTCKNKKKLDSICVKDMLHKALQDPIFIKVWSCHGTILILAVNA